MDAVSHAEENNTLTKVMVIDDSKTIRRTAETLLAKAGFTVITASDGFEALAKVVDHQPDIIFMDIMMPRLDGYQACALIKNNDAFKNTPIIMLSSKDGLFDRALQFGVALVAEAGHDDVVGGVHGDGRIEVRSC